MISEGKYGPDLQKLINDSEGIKKLRDEQNSMLVNKVAYIVKIGTYTFIVALLFLIFGAILLLAVKGFLVVFNGIF